MSVPTVDPSDTLAVLKAAEEWLSDPAHWTRYAYGRNYRNQSVIARTKAESTCVLGALAFVAGAKELRDFPLEASAYLYQALGANPVQTVNDGPNGYFRIMDGLREAIEKLEARQS